MTIAGSAARRSAPRSAVGARLHWVAREHVLVSVVVAIAALAHGINMQNFPYLEDDEGTYAAQAWAVIHEGKLSPYTYFYDHAPGGWLQIAAWQALTGGANGKFGDAIASGRVFMLVLQSVTTLLVIVTGRKLTGKLWPGLLAGLIFGLSPYGLPYHRRVLLDNVTTLWMVGSFLLLLAKPLKLSRVWLSAAALAAAVWSKEIALVLIPAMALLVFRQAPRHGRLLALAGWLTLTVSLISIYPLMAILKGEMFPVGSALGGTQPHVSLLCSMQWEASRGADGGIANFQSAFWQTAGQWVTRDPVLILGGTAAALVCMVAFRRHPPLAALGWVTVSFWLFLGRGGMILDFYLVPLLPFLALAIAVLAHRLPLVVAQRATRYRATLAVGLALTLSLGCISGLGYYLAQPDNRAIWLARPVTGQEQAVAWVEQRVPPQSKIIMDMYMWVDLHDMPKPGEAPFTSAHYYWTAAEDPAIRQLFKNDWRSVDYIITTPQLIHDTRTQGFPLIGAALAHSRSVAHFDTGIPVDIRRVDAGVGAKAQALPLPPSGTSASPPPSCMNEG